MTVRSRCCLDNQLTYSVEVVHAYHWLNVVTTCCSWLVFCCLSCFLLEDHTFLQWITCRGRWGQGRWRGPEHLAGAMAHQPPAGYGSGQSTCVQTQRMVLHQTQQACSTFVHLASSTWRPPCTHSVHVTGGKRMQLQTCKQTRTKLHRVTLDLNCSTDLQLWRHIYAV